MMTRKEALNEAFDLGLRDYQDGVSDKGRTGVYLRNRFRCSNSRNGDEAYLRSAYMAGRWDVKFPSNTTSEDWD